LSIVNCQLHFWFSLIKVIVFYHLDDLILRVTSYFWVFSLSIVNFPLSIDPWLRPVRF